MFLSRSLVVRAAFLGAVVIAGCATSSTGIDDPLPTQPIEAGSTPLPPATPTPSAQGTSTPLPDADAAASVDAAPVDAGKKPTDASAPFDSAPPPPPPQVCLMGDAGARLPVQTPCGCDNDCTSKLVCAKVGGLVDPWCCAPAAGACVDANDCCGQLTCQGGLCK